MWLIGSAIGFLVSGDGYVLLVLKGGAGCIGVSCGNYRALTVYRLRNQRILRSLLSTRRMSFSLLIWFNQGCKFGFSFMRLD